MGQNSVRANSASDNFRWLFLGRRAIIHSGGDANLCDPFEIVVQEPLIVSPVEFREHSVTFEVVDIVSRLETYSHLF